MPKMKKTTAEQEVSLSYHIICLVLNYFAVLHDQNLKFEWFTFQRYGGKWKFMSHLLLYAVTIYTVYSIAVDIINIFTGNSGRPDEDQPLVVRVRDRAFNDMLQPFALGHSLVFLFTSIIDNSLFVSVINRRKENLLSYYMMFFHMFPLVFSVLESALVYHKPSKADSVKIPVALALLYESWILWIAYFGSYWSYPFLRRATAVVKILCLALLPVIIAGCHFVGRKATQFFWGLNETSITMVDEKKTN